MAVKRDWAGAREALWAACFGAVAFVAVLAAERLALLEPLELWTYDRLGAIAYAQIGDDKQIALVTIDEPAIVALGWPLSDEKAAELLERVLAGNPRAIGLDLYRDQPHPPGSERLGALLARDRRIVGTMFLADRAGNRVPPPAALANTDRAAAADLPVDGDGSVRRGLLYREDGAKDVMGLAVRVAVAHLEKDGIVPRADPANPSNLMLGSASYRPFEAGDGGYARADAGGYQFLLDYGRRAPRFVAHGIADVLNGRVAADAFRDRSVLIGVIAPSAKDFFQVPPGAARQLDRPVIYGVELQAFALAQILRQARGETFPTRTLLPRTELWRLAAWCIGGAVAGVLVGGPVAVLVVMLAGLLVMSTICGIVLRFDWWLPLIAPALGWIASLGSVAGRRLAIQFHQKAQLQRMFSRFVDPGVADLLWRQRDVFLSGGRPRPARFQATVLLSDLAGFSAASEALDPAQVMDWVGLYMDHMTDLVIDRGGMVEKFAGDGLLAVFGSPADGEDADAAAANARHALDCAQAMRPAIDALNADFQARGLPMLRVRIGIHSGPMVAGAMGSARRSQYTVIGDTPNVAARLEAFDKDNADFGGRDGWCRVLVSATTAAQAGGGYSFEKFAETTVRGRTGVVEILRLV